MRQRTDRDVWQQLYDFHLIETERLISSLDELPGLLALMPILSQAIVTAPTRIYTHILSHQRIQAQFWVLQISPDKGVELPEKLIFLSHEEIENVPKPVLITSYWKEQFF
jgi:A/G-specific adenine glycosylase